MYDVLGREQAMSSAVCKHKLRDLYPFRGRTFCKECQNEVTILSVNAHEHNEEAARLLRESEWHHIPACGCGKCAVHDEFWYCPDCEVESAYPLPSVEHKLCWNEELSAKDQPCKQAAWFAHDRERSKS